MKTNELEKELGLSKHTIRYYEKEGFIQPSRDENGYRNYNDIDVQTLKLVKFLRNLEISIDDVKLIIDGELDFQECLRINQVHLDKHIEGMKEIKQTIDDYANKELPLIPALSEIDKKVKSKSYFGIQKTTDTISLGRRLTREWAIRQVLYGLASSLFLTFAMGRFVLMVVPMPSWMRVTLFILVTIIIEIIFIAMAYRQTSGALIDNSMDQSIEFLEVGIRYYEFKGPISNFKYFLAILLNKENTFMHNYRYEDIQEVEVIAKRRYMNLGSPIAYEVYVSDFNFKFDDGNSFYFCWPTILEDDSRYIAIIIEEKIKHIKDSYNLLYAMKNGINLNDYLMGEYII